MRDLTLQIEGMSCSHCLNAVSRALVDLPGVEVQSLGIGRIMTLRDALQACRKDAMSDLQGSELVPQPR